MHIPDGFLSMPSSAGTWMAAAGWLGWAGRMVRSRIGQKTVPLMGVLSAFIFAAQMVNFPVMGGTSGHLLGGALAAVLLGPFAGALVLGGVLIVQCLVFQDGGITALGANLVNMAGIGVISAYGVFRFCSRVLPGKRGVLLSAGIAAWGSVVLASIACSFELAFMSPISVSAVLPAMTFVHAVIGVGEGVITAGVLAVILRVRPDLLEKGGLV